LVLKNIFRLFVVESFTEVFSFLLMSLLF